MPFGQFLAHSGETDHLPLQILILGRELRAQAQRPVSSLPAILDPSIEWLKTPPAWFRCGMIAMGWASTGRVHFQSTEARVVDTAYGRMARQYGYLLHP